jgi:hypothetical protein
MLKATLDMNDTMVSKTILGRLAYVQWTLNRSRSRYVQPVARNKYNTPISAISGQVESVPEYCLAYERAESSDYVCNTFSLVMAYRGSLNWLLRGSSVPSKLENSNSSSSHAD